MAETLTESTLIDGHRKSGNHFFISIARNRVFFDRQPKRPLVQVHNRAVLLIPPIHVRATFC